MTDKALTAVLHDLARVLQGIAPGQEQLPTPCAAMDVLTLRGHVLGWLHYFDVALADPAGEQRPDPTQPPAPETGNEIDHLVTTVATAVDTGIDTVTVNMPRLGGVLPGPVVLDLLISEALGHGWDLARATGQPWQPDPATCERALVTLHAVVQPAYRGDGLPFGPEVPVAPAAPALDRFVAFTGRDPKWRAAGPADLQ